MSTEPSRNVTSAFDIANYTPSLGANNLFGNENTTFSLRGFSQDIGTAAAVGVYFADVVSPRGGNLAINVGDGAGSGNFFDLENMQVLKGPQGTLFGRNTTGGAILLVPAKPTDRFEGFLEGSIGNYNLRRLQAVVNAPISDNLRVRLGVDRQLRDGYLKNDSGIGPRDFNDSNYFAARFSVVADLAPNLENYLIASYSHSNTNGSLQKIIACNDTPLSENPYNFLGLQACDLIESQDAKGFWHINNQVAEPKSDLEQWQLINTTTWDVSDNLTIKNIISYAELTYDVATNVYGTNFELGGLPFDFATMYSMPNSHAAHQSTFSEELQLQGSFFDSRLDWQAGAYLEISKPLSGIAGTHASIFNSCSDPVALQCVDVTGRGIVNLTGGAIEYRNVGLFSQATYQVTDELNVTGGIRYTWDKTSGLSQQITYVFPDEDAVAVCTDPLKASLPDCTTKQLQKSKAPTWLLGLDYSPSRDVMLYSKWSRCYRTGGLKPDVPAPYDRFDEEKVDTFEVGAKTGFRGAISGNFNISAFYNKFSNQQLLIQFTDNPLEDSAVSPTAGPVNAGKSKIFGIEVEGSLSLFDGFRIDGSCAYLDTKIQSIDNVTLPDTSPYVASGIIRRGDELTFAPDHKWSITTAYDVPMDSARGQISLAATWTHIGRQRYNYAGRLPGVIEYTGGKDINVQNAVNMLNLNVNWSNVAGSPVDLSLFMTNVTNEKFYGFTGPIFLSTGFETGTLNEPRMFGARLRVNFGG